VRQPMEVALWTDEDIFKAAPQRLHEQ
jgi:hypothetical protein